MARTSYGASISQTMIVKRVCSCSFWAFCEKLKDWVHPRLPISSPLRALRCLADLRELEIFEALRQPRERKRHGRQGGQAQHVRAADDAHRVITRTRSRHVADTAAASAAAASAVGGGRGAIGGWRRGERQRVWERRRRGGQWRSGLGAIR